MGWRKGDSDLDLDFVCVFCFGYLCVEIRHNLSFISLNFHIFSIHLPSLPFPPISHTQIHRAIHAKYTAPHSSPLSLRTTQASMCSSIQVQFYEFFGGGVCVGGVCVGVSVCVSVCMSVNGYLWECAGEYFLICFDTLSLSLRSVSLPNTARGCQEATAQVQIRLYCPSLVPRWHHTHV